MNLIAIIVMMITLLICWIVIGIWIIDWFNSRRIEKIRVKKWSDSFKPKVIDSWFDKGKNEN